MTARVSYEAAAVGDYVGDHLPRACLRWSIRFKAGNGPDEARGVVAAFSNRLDADQFLDEIEEMPGAERFYLLVDETIGEVVDRRDVEAA